jgi:predicted nucleic acid-binding protein
MLLLDNSAWARLNNPDLADGRRSQIAELIVSGGIATCLPFLLEAGYSARTGPDHETLMRRLSRLPHVAISPVVEELARSAQHSLASSGHHRLAPNDIVLAALAHHHHAGVLHYDKDYDLLHQHTDLSFDSEWLAPRGTLS